MKSPKRRCFYQISVCFRQYAQRYMLVLCGFIEFLQDPLFFRFKSVKIKVDYIDKLWLETRKILLDDELYNVIVYWSCVGQPAEYCFLITPRMRELLRELI